MYNGKSVKIILILRQLHPFWRLGRTIRSHAWEVWRVVPTVVNGVWWICCHLSYCAPNPPLLNGFHIFYARGWEFANTISEVVIHWMSLDSCYPCFFRLQLNWVELSWVTHCDYLKDPFGLSSIFTIYSFIGKVQVWWWKGKRQELVMYHLKSNIKTLLHCPRGWRRSCEESYCSINLKKMSFQFFFWRGW